MTSRKSPDFRSILKQLSHGHDTSRVFEAFARFAACALAAGTREKEYMEEVARWTKEEMGLFTEAFAGLVSDMETKPFEDVIGGFYMESALSRKGQQWNGEFHTPKPICDLMASLTIGDIGALPATGPITVCEPACGAGAMMLSFAEACPVDVRRRLRFTAIDISRVACDMAFVNTTLWGLPTRIIHGNTLSMEYWASWSNIHFIAPWLPLALRPQTEEAKAQGKPPTSTEVQAIAMCLGQQELALG